METVPTPAPVTPPPPRTSWGILIALVLIVAAIVAGALFALNKRAAMDPLREQGTTTDPAQIEGDLEAHSPEDFDRELDEAFVELDAAFEN